MRSFDAHVACALACSVAVAQTPAVKSLSENNPAAPVPGANSFTEGQAKSRIEGAGYTDVSGLRKDGSGVWTGLRKTARRSP